MTSWRDFPCIPWNTHPDASHADSAGYGRTRGKKYTMVHRAAYEEVHGPIPEGLVIDHLCRNRSCIQVHHLEAVTHAENIRRIYANKTHCARGHEYSGTNVYTAPNGQRYCRICNGQAQRRWRERQAANAA